jgi:Predicted xylanase/chitin deacetylase
MISLKLRLIREHNRMYSFILSILWKLNGKNTPKVYLFHDLKDDIAEVKSQFSITQQSFEHFLLLQLSKGDKPMTYEELKEVVLNKKDEKNRFIVSFDDANESVYTKAYPFLKQHKIPFIIFITKELIGKPNYLTKEQIERLSADELCTVGSHAVHHKMFRYLSIDEANEELTESKIFLEKWLKCPIEIFAFPYGRVVECSCRNIRQLKESGNYLFAFSAVAGTLKQSWFSSRFFLPRINVSEKMTEE